MTWVEGIGRSIDAVEEYIKSRLRVLRRKYGGQLISIDQISDLISGYIPCTLDDITAYGLEKGYLLTVAGHSKKWKVAVGNGSDPPQSSVVAVSAPKSPTKSFPEKKRTAKVRLDPAERNSGKFARQSDRQNNLDRWLRYIRKEYCGQTVSKETFLRHMPSMFAHDRSTWVSNAINQALARHIIESIFGETGEWRVIDNNRVPDIVDSLLPPRQPVNDVKVAKSVSAPDETTDQEKSEDAPLDTSPDEKKVEKRDMPKQPEEFMTEKKLFELGASEELILILKSVFMLCGFEVYRNRDLRPTHHRYRDDERDLSAFTQRLSFARNLGIILRTNSQGDVDVSARGYGRFDRDMVPVEWIEEREVKFEKRVSEHEKKVESTVWLHGKVASDPSLPPPASHSSASDAANAEDGKSEDEGRRTRDLELENAALRGELRAYQQYDHMVEEIVARVLRRLGDALIKQQS